MEIEFDIYNIIGLVGVFFYILAYLLITIKKVSAESLSYIIMNMLGASLVLVSLVKHPNIPSIITQTVWILISFVGIYNAVKSRKEKKQ